MSSLPLREQQIITAHASFICKVVASCNNEQRRPEYDALLRDAEESGWLALAAAIRQIVAGQRDMEAIRGLDEEDRVIAEAIMRGLQNPANLPNPDAKPDPALAAPGLAGMIKAAVTGNIQALSLISNMAEQMSRTGGPMARLAAVIRPLINGERDPDILCRGMDEKTEQVVIGILDELKKSELN
ncbi:MAG: hypothetical protein GY703_15730 [Gammaproteobacteria bacterium]|nr:hypothetical protein [Gammaproteobacteria bacterium]